MSEQNGQGPILIVDDDSEVRHVLRIMFELEGYSSIYEATNGVEAVPLALKYQPAFVILDYLMPHLDGEGTASLLRAVAPGTKIVAFSAVLEEKPPWSDAFLNKDRIKEILPLLGGLI